jgi:hypothetical protein
MFFFTFTAAFFSYPFFQDKHKSLQLALDFVNTETALRLVLQAKFHDYQSSGSSIWEHRIFAKKIYRTINN